MKYNITLTDEDYLQFNIFYAYHSRGGKRSVRTAQIVLAILCIASILLLLLTDIAPGLVLTEAAVFAIFFVLLFLRTPKLMKKSVQKNMERLRRDGKLPYLAYSEIEFQDDMLVQRHAQGEFRLKYEDIENIYYENDCIYIFYTALQAFIIPYRFLGTDKDRVIEFITEKKG